MSAFFFPSLILFIITSVVFQGIDGGPGEKGEDGENGQPVSIAIHFPIVQKFLNSECSDLRQ